MSDDKEPRTVTEQDEEEEEEPDYTKSKLQKQLTQRKRGSTPKPGAKAKKGKSTDGDEEESKKSASSVKSKRGEQSGLYKTWRQYAPTYLHQRPASKMMFDAAFFAVSLVVVCKLGKGLNDMISDYVPSEASMRDQMAQAQLQMQAQ